MTPFQVVTDADLLKATLFNRSSLTECGCWEWRGSKDAHGYAFISRGNKTLRAHRVSYEAHNGPIPDGMVVRHACDTPSCINPNHLLVGTQQDNANDREIRGRRNVWGERVGTAKLTEREVQEIRSSDLSNADLARQHSVDKSNIWAIRAGKSWKHAVAASGL